MRPIKQLASDTVLYGLSSVVGRVLNYLLVPLYTSILVPAEYGLLTEWYAYAAILRVLYTCGMESTYLRFAKHEPAAHDVATSALLISSMVFSSLLIGLATPIATILARPGCEAYVYYLAAIMAVDTILVIPLAQLRLRNQVRSFVGIKFLQTGLNVSINLVLLYGCANVYMGHYLPDLRPWVARCYDPSKHVDYIFMANLVANAMAIPVLRRSLFQIKFQMSWQRLKPLLAYAWPLLLMGLGGTIHEILGRVTLRHWLPTNYYPGQSNEAILGIFGACCKLATLMPISIQAFRYAAEPFFFKHAPAYNASILFGRVMHWSVLGMCFVLFSVSINLDLLGVLLLKRSEYRTGLGVVPYLMLGHLLLGVYYNLSVWFKLTYKTFYGASFVGIGTLVIVGLTRLLIPQMGYWGSAWAAIASYAIMCLLCYRWGQRYYPISYRPSLLLGYILGTLGCVHGLRRIVYTNWTHAMVGNLVLTLLFGGLIYKIGRYSEQGI